jgi:hypothetical protein
MPGGHGKLKQLIRPVRGFKALKTAYATIKGFEVMCNVGAAQGQASSFNITRDMCGAARLVERAFAKTLQQNQNQRRRAAPSIILKAAPQGGGSVPGAQEHQEAEAVKGAASRDGRGRHRHGWRLLAPDSKGLADYWAQDREPSSWH